MQSPRFANCIELLNTPIENLSPGNPEESSLLGSVDEIADFYLDLVTIELEDELGNKNTPEQREYLIKLYVSRLMKSKNHRSVKDINLGAEVAVNDTDKKNMPPSTSLIGDVLIMDIQRNEDHEILFRQGCNILYHLLFNEVQKSCLVFNIPFMEICNELNFDLDSINTEYYAKNVKGERYRNSEKSKQNIQTEIAPIFPDEPDNEKAFSDIKNSDNLFWRGLPMDIVVDHFKVFTTRKSKNGKTFLTDEQLISFLRKGFLNVEEEPQQKINISYSEKGFIIKRFYELYLLARKEYEFPLKKEKFISLIYDCFDNWVKNTIAFFFKPNKSMEEW